MLNISFLGFCIVGSFILSEFALGKRKRTYKDNSHFDGRLGIPIASDTIIQQYENEHKMMHRKEDGTINKVEYLAWPAKLGDENLTVYCGKYLKMVVPKRNVHSMFGEPKVLRMSYLNDGSQYIHIGGIRCHVPLNNSRIYGRSHYITEAPQTECVYALKRRHKGDSPFKIVLKVCGFESKDAPNDIYSNLNLEDRKKSEFKIKPETGIPIAFDNLIAEYKYKHQEMYKKDDGSFNTGDSVLQKRKSTFEEKSHFDRRLGISIASDTIIQQYENEHKLMHRKEDGTPDEAEYLAWTSKLGDRSLTEYCGKCLKTIIPKRNIENMFAEPKILTMSYSKEGSQFIYVAGIRCHIPTDYSRVYGRSYYITESPQTECVYTLKRREKGDSPFKIIFKVCGFESNGESNYKYSNKYEYKHQEMYKMINGSFVTGDSVLQKRKSTYEENSHFDKRLGISIASDTIIQQYENEHKMMHQKEDGSPDEAEYLAWTSKLSDKNLTEYCGKYLKMIIPKRNIVNMFAEPKILTMSYLKEGSQLIYVAGIRCHIPTNYSRVYGRSYHITEAPQIECVFTLKRREQRDSPFQIVFKVCGFENNDAPNYMYSNVKLKDRRESVFKIHPKTGIPIAFDHLITEYEHKHQEMYKMIDGTFDTEKYIGWPMKRTEPYLSDFCREYLRVIVPNRIKNDDIFGETDGAELRYSQSNLISLPIGIIRCIILSNKGNRKESLSYYLTESSEPDCVYVLLRLANVVPICKIVNQVCGITKNEKVLKAGNESNPINPSVHDANEWEGKPDLTTMENMELNKSSSDDSAEKWEKKLDLKFFTFFPID